MGSCHIKGSLIKLLGIQKNEQRISYDLLYFQEQYLICYDMLYIQNVGESVKSFAEAVSTEPIKVRSSRIYTNSILNIY